MAGFLFFTSVIMSAWELGPNVQTKGNAFLDAQLELFYFSIPQQRSRETLRILVLSWLGSPI